MIGIASAVTVLVVAVLSIVITADPGTAGSHTRPSLPALLGSGPSRPESDEDQIRATLSAIQESWNDFDYVTFMSYACERIRDRNSTAETRFTQQRNDIGTVSFAIDSVTVAGDTAQAEVAETFSKQDSMSETLDFVKEDDQWVLC
jgi:predicted lipid-binding transport protein (Tim44 family)